MGWLVAFFFAICTGLLILAVIVQGDEYRRRSLRRSRNAEEDLLPPNWAARSIAAPGSTGATDRKLDAAPAIQGLAADQPHVDSVIADRYRIVATIGRGGMGVVYRAWDHVAERYTVIKMPRADLMVDGSARERFRRELEMVRSLDHPSIVPVLDVGEFHALTSIEPGGTGTPFAVMPYLAGGSLQRRRQRSRHQSSAPPSFLWDWLPEVAEALDHVHSRGMLHRDVKPANVLFDGLGRPYLGDFGVAKAACVMDGLNSELTQAGFAIGTPTYMAPEFVAGTASNARADQYSLAVMVFECVACRPPFTAATPAAVLWCHASVPAPRLDSIRPELPGSYVRAVDRGLHKSQDERFVSCSAFVEALLTDIPKPRRPPPPKLMCPDCGKLLNARYQWAGRTGRCPHCRVQLEISADLQSLWLRRDRSERPRSPSNRRRRPLPPQLEWIDRNGLLMTVVLSMIFAALMGLAWGLLPLILATLASSAAGVWWMISPARTSGEASVKRQSQYDRPSTRPDSPDTQ